jgi:parvulin-like peptidyl-prolyl isomerase
LNQKIDELILLQEAKKQNIKVDKKEIQDVVENQKKSMNNMSDEDFNAELQKSGFSRKEYELRIENNLYFQKLVRQVIEPIVSVPAEEQVREFYNKIYSKLNGSKVGNDQEDAFITQIANQLRRAFSKQVRISQIFVNLPDNAPDADVDAARQKINLITDALSKTNDFASVASQYSDDPASRQRNGDMGFVANGDLIPSLNDVVFANRVGFITPRPIKTTIGYHFLRIDAESPAREVSFDTVKNDLSNILYQQNVRSTSENYIKDLRTRADIKIND